MKDKMCRFRLSPELDDLLKLKSEKANLNASEFLRRSICFTRIIIEANNKK